MKLVAKTILLLLLSTLTPTDDVRIIAKAADEFADPEQDASEECRSQCQPLMSWGTGLCAGIAGLGAPIACLVTGLTALPCILVESTFWAFGGYCTSSANDRLCEYCNDLDHELAVYEDQLVIRDKLIDIKDKMSQTRRSDWHKFSAFVHHSRYFREATAVDNLFYLLDKSNGGGDRNAKMRDFFADMFQRTALSAGRQGALALIVAANRVVLGDRFGEIFFADKKSACSDPTLAREFDSAFFSLMQSFFAAVGMKSGESDVVDNEAFLKAFSRMRAKQTVKFRTFCAL